MNDSTTERQLRKALERVSAPPGFSSRVMAAIDQPAHKNKNRLWYALAAAVLALVFLFTGVDQKQKERQKRMKAEETERQVVYALALTMQKLNHINGRLQDNAPDVRVEDKGEGRGWE